MSWSISLSGPPQVVTRELSDAILLLDKSIDWAQNSNADAINVLLSGSVSWDDAGGVTASNVSFSVGETVNPEKTNSE
jgi:hypothetical protein